MNIDQNLITKDFSWPQQVQQLFEIQVSPLVYLYHLAPDNEWNTVPVEASILMHNQRYTDIHLRVQVLDFSAHLYRKKNHMILSAKSYDNYLLCAQQFCFWTG